MECKTQHHETKKSTRGGIEVEYEPHTHTHIHRITRHEKAEREYMSRQEKSRSTKINDRL